MGTLIKLFVHLLVLPVKLMGWGLKLLAGAGKLGLGSWKLALLALLGASVIKAKEERVAVE